MSDIPSPINTNSTPIPAAMAATPKATTEVKKRGLQERGGESGLPLGVLAVKLRIGKPVG